jgi:hypothetical protein
MARFRALLPRRGGRRSRHLPSGVPVLSSGRWGRRRARDNECWSILRAEEVYDQFLRERVALKPGWRASVRVQIPIEGSKAVHPWSLEVEVLPNQVYRSKARVPRQAGLTRRLSARQKLGVRMAAGAKGVS